MKTVIIFLIFLGIVVANLSEDNLLLEDKECIKELGLNMESILNNINDDIIATEGLPEMNDFMFCSLKKLKGYNENTKTIHCKALKPAIIKYANLMNGGVVIPEKVVEDACENCKNLEGSDTGDKLVKIANCIMKYVKQ